MRVLNFAPYLTGEQMKQVRGLCVDAGLLDADEFPLYTECPMDYSDLGFLDLGQEVNDMLAMSLTTDDIAKDIAVILPLFSPAAGLVLSTLIREYECQPWIVQTQYAYKITTSCVEAGVGADFVAIHRF